MSYLTLANGIPNFSKAVFSFWFRVPKESITAALKRSQADERPFKIMQYVLPLVTFGKPQVNKNYQAITVDVADYLYTPDNYVPYNTTHYIAGEPYDVDPCFIGVLYSDDGTFRLAFNIQMGDYMAVNATDWITTKMTFYPSDNAPGTGAEGDGTVFGGTAKATIEDASYIENAQPEWFSVESQHNLDPGKWHHVLLSFDVSSSVAIGHPQASSDCKLWYAIDDVDYRGQANLQPWRDADDGLGDNTILTRNVWRESVPIRPPVLYQNTPVAEPAGSYGPVPIPTHEAALGIPASAKYVDYIFRVEMAEFQLFTGVTLDTGIDHNRRAFVDKEGKPVDPTGTEDEPGPGEKLLGKKPAVLLHSSGNWQTGYNTGTLGIKIEDDGTITKLPDGQFNPTAKIEPYKPEPALETA